MNYLKKYKIIWTQAIIFILLGSLRNHNLYLFFGCILTTLPFHSPKIALQYIFITEKFINTIGTWLKNCLFTLLFIFIIIPLKMLTKKKAAIKNTTYSDEGKVYVKNNFEKLW